MEDDRIVRIARALCRSARLDPDLPIEQSGRNARPAAASGPVATWTVFIASAEAFVANQDERTLATY